MHAQTNLENHRVKLDNKKIAESALIILKKKLWKNLSINELKKKSNVKSFDKIIKSKKDLIKIINNYFDYKLLLKCKNIEKSNTRDMIFEVIMIRFDLLQAHKRGVVSIFDSFKSNPKELLFLLPNLFKSIIIMTEYANFPKKNFTASLKIKSIFLIYVASFIVWTKDDSSSMEKTMTSLDGYLNQSEKIFKVISGY